MTSPFNGFRKPLLLVAGVLALLGVALLFKSGGGAQAAACLIGAAAVLFGSWAITAPPPREREGMLDGAIDSHTRRKGETQAEFERRKAGRRWGLD